METLAAVGVGAVLIMLLVWVASGIIVGLIARWLMPGPDPMGWGKTFLIGIAGSFIGGLIGRLSGLNAKVPDFLFSIGGAMLLLLILRARKR